MFPKKFCQTRCLENSTVAERAAEIFPNVELYIEKYPKSRKSAQTSFVKSQDDVKDH